MDAGWWQLAAAAAFVFVAGPTTGLGALLLIRCLDARAARRERARRRAAYRP